MGADQARDEAIQLLYVGLTRARDRLILTGTGPVGKWLGLLASPLFPAREVLSLPEGRYVPVEVATLAEFGEAHGWSTQRSLPGRCYRILANPRVRRQ